MPSRKWTPEEDAELWQLYSNLGRGAAKASYLSMHPDRTERALESRLIALTTRHKARTPIILKDADFLMLPGEPLRVPGNPVMVTSDLHIPFHDAHWLNRMITVAMMRGIKTLVMGGDVIDVDAYTKFLRLGRADTFSRELQEAEDVLDAFLRWFDPIYWFWGNHELRFERLTEGEIAAARWVRMISTADNLYVSKWRYCYFEEHPKWCLTHPGRFQQIHTRVGNRLNWIYDQHSIVAHGHRLAMGYDDAMKYMIIDSGGLYDWQKLEYLTMSQNTYPRVNPGFVVLEDGFPTVYGTEPMSDWREVDAMIEEAKRG